MASMVLQFVDMVPADKNDVEAVRTVQQNNVRKIDLGFSNLGYIPKKCTKQRKCHDYV